MSVFIIISSVSLMCKIRLTKRNHTIDKILTHVVHICKPKYRDTTQLCTMHSCDTQYTAQDGSDNVQCYHRSWAVVCWRHDKRAACCRLMQTSDDSVIRPLPATVFSHVTSRLQ